MNGNASTWITIRIKGATKVRLEENRAPGQSSDGFIGQLVDLWEKTKARLEENRAPGQDYDDFIWQLVDSWERTEKERAGSAGGNQGANVSHSRKALEKTSSRI